MLTIKKKQTQDEEKKRKKRKKLAFSSLKKESDEYKKNVSHHILPHHAGGLCNHTVHHFTPPPQKIEKATAFFLADVGVHRRFSQHIAHSLFFNLSEKRLLAKNIYYFSSYKSDDDDDDDDVLENSYGFSHRSPHHTLSPLSFPLHAGVATHPITRTRTRTHTHARAHTHTSSIKTRLPLISHLARPRETRDREPSHKPTSSRIPSHHGYRNIPLIPSGSLTKPKFL